VVEWPMNMIIIVWIGLGIFFMAYSYALGLGKLKGVITFHNRFGSRVPLRKKNKFVTLFQKSKM
jgi:hypothetical protein